uniref:Uncharacterized protein n=1 Tax=Steinernema glaseri TaxID=37863 RepID=A0A1I7YT02_9BILA
MSIFSLEHKEPSTGSLQETKKEVPSGALVTFPSEPVASRILRNYTNVCAVHRRERINCVPLSITRSVYVRSSGFSDRENCKWGSGDLDHDNCG